MPSIQHLCPPIQVEQQAPHQSPQFHFSSYIAHQLLFYRPDTGLRTLACRVN